MVSNAFAFKAFATFSFEPTFVYQLLYQLRMMDHLVIAAQTGVLVFDGIKAMRTTRDYLFDIVTIQHLYIHHSLHLEQELVTRAFGRVAGTGFLGSQYREAYAHMVQYFADIAGNTLRAFVETAGTAYPEEYLRFLALRGHLRHGQYLCFTHILVIGSLGHWVIKPD
jgi:hypothetical protein